MPSSISQCPEFLTPAIEKYPASTPGNRQDTKVPRYEYITPQTYPRLNNYLPYTWRGSALLNEKSLYENTGFAGFEADLNGIDQEGQPNNENAPIMDLNNYSDLDFDASSPSLDTSLTRRLSGSTLSTSSREPITEPFELSVFSEVPTFVSDYTPSSLLNLSATNMSPKYSPSRSHQNHGRAGSHSWVSQSSRPSFRTAPYSFDGVRSKPWSSASCATSPARRDSTLTHNSWEGSGPHVSRITTHHQSPLLPSSNIFSNKLPYSLHILPQSFISSTSCLPCDSALLSSSYEALGHPFQEPSSLSSHGLPHTLHSDLDPHNLHQNHYSYLTNPPDLFAPLLDEQMSPPPEDMHPNDPNLFPREQELRFEGDLYTPRRVRGHGNKREGWCGICKPGRWLVLKNSAFWYDKSFTHGVSAATGIAFDGPEKTRRVDRNPDVWEGLCVSCGDWIALLSTKKKGTTWFRHAYKCHTHPKFKDAPKRRREAPKPKTGTSLLQSLPSEQTTAHHATP